MFHGTDEHFFHVDLIATTCIVRRCQSRCDARSCPPNFRGSPPTHPPLARPPLQDGWFAESEVMWPGQAMMLKVEEVLYEGRTDFQDVLVFRSATYGTVLVLDGVIQVTERDEHAYQEMITQIPMHCHPDPQNVLIVGGGDGGVLREVCRHPGVQRITMCELDPLVVSISKRYLGASTASAFDDQRLTLVHADAAQFVKDQLSVYDVVIVDSSDPVGAAETLFTADFYMSLRRAMRPGAIMCNQGECVWLHLSLIAEVLKHCREVFPSVDYAFTTIPTYPSGQIGFLICSTTPGHVLRQPVREPEPAVAASLKYYSPAVHAAAFVLPGFAEKVVAAVRSPQLPSLCSSVRTPLVSSVSLAFAAAGVLVGVAAAAALGAARPR
jgi:spermidine synthase